MLPTKKSSPFHFTRFIRFNSFHSRWWNTVGAIFFFFLFAFVCLWFFMNWGDFLLSPSPYLEQSQWNYFFWQQGNRKMTKIIKMIRERKKKIYCDTNVVTITIKIYTFCIVVSGSKIVDSFNVLCVFHAFKWSTHCVHFKSMSSNAVQCCVLLLVFVLSFLGFVAMI